MGPRGAHIHFSSDKCSDFSCLVQSYLELNVSVQNVHWKTRFLSLVSLRDAFGAGRRLRLRSRLPAKDELNDP